MWSALSSLMGAIVVVAGGVMLYAYSAAIKAFLWNVLTQVVAPIFIAFVVVAVVIGAAKS